MCCNLILPLMQSYGSFYLVLVFNFILQFTLEIARRFNLLNKSSFQHSDAVEYIRSTTGACVMETATTIANIKKDPKIRENI